MVPRRETCWAGYSGRCTVLLLCRLVFCLRLEADSIWGQFLIKSLSVQIPSLTEDGKTENSNNQRIFLKGTESRSVLCFGQQLVLEAGRGLWMKFTSLRAALCHEERMEGHTGLDSPHWPWAQRLVTQHLEPGRRRLLGRGLRDGPYPQHLWLSSLETQLGVPWASLIRQFQVRSLKQDWGKI